jgi:hypothetical protein
MEALVNVDGMQSVCLQKGKLSLREEFANQVAEIIAAFLARP